MLRVLLDAWSDTLEMVPFLFVIYVFVELAEDKFEAWIKNLIVSSRAVGPILGALCGCVPQCGFSVIATVLYTQRVMSLGTLLAVYISTSDEAIPVILSQPGKINLVVPIILIKMTIAIIAGYVVDWVAKNFEHAPYAKIAAVLSVVEESHCCGREHVKKEHGFKSFILYPLWHTAEICFFIFVVSFVISFVIAKVGADGMHHAFLTHTIYQPVICAFVGMIPNCAASVAITQFFLKGGISFGSVIAGLSTSAGLGMLVLIKENKDFIDTIKVMILLFGISAVSGILIDLTVGGVLR